MHNSISASLVSTEIFQPTFQPDNFYIHHLKESMYLRYGSHDGKAFLDLGTLHIIHYILFTQKVKKVADNSGSISDKQNV